VRVVRFDGVTHAAALAVPVAVAPAHAAEAARLAVILALFAVIVEPTDGAKVLAKTHKTRFAILRVP
jgi:hypothetical protein